MSWIHSVIHIWDVKNDTGYFLPPRLVHTVGRGRTPDPRDRTELMLTLKPGRPGQNSECTHTKNTLARFTGACPSRTRARAGQRYRTHSVQYLKQVGSAALMHTCPFIGSTLIDAEIYLALQPHLL